MSATGKTPNFNIPVYNAGDTANYLTSYNNAMNIIDGQMQANKSAAAVAQSAINNLDQEVGTLEEAVNEIHTGITNSNFKPITITPHSNVASMPNVYGIYNDIMLLFAFTASVNKQVSAIPVKVSADSNTFMPIATVPGNPLNLATGISNEISYAPFGYVVYQDASDSNTYKYNVTAIAVWYVDNATYIGINITSYANDDTIGNISFNGFIPVNK